MIKRLRIVNKNKKQFTQFYSESESLGSRGKGNRDAKVSSITNIIFIDNLNCTFTQLPLYHILGRYPRTPNPLNEPRPAWIQTTKTCIAILITRVKFKPRRQVHHYTLRNHRDRCCYSHFTSPHPLSEPRSSSNNGDKGYCSIPFRFVTLHSTIYGLVQ